MPHQPGYLPYVALYHPLHTSHYGPPHLHAAAQTSDPQPHNTRNNQYSTLPPYMTSPAFTPYHHPLNQYTPNHFTQNQHNNRQQFQQVKPTVPNTDTTTPWAEEFAAARLERSQMQSTLEEILRRLDDLQLPRMHQQYPPPQPHRFDENDALNDDVSVAVEFEKEEELKPQPTAIDEVEVPLTEGQANHMPSTHQKGQVTVSSVSMAIGLDNHLHKDLTNNDFQGGVSSSYLPPSQVNPPLLPSTSNNSFANTGVVQKPVIVATPVVWNPGINTSITTPASSRDPSLGYAGLDVGNLDVEQQRQRMTDAQKVLDEMLKLKADVVHNQYSIDTIFGWVLRSDGCWEHVVMEKNVLILDLGGSTFDVSLLTIEEVLKILAEGDDREVDTNLLVHMQLDKFSLIKFLLHNQLKSVWCTRLDRAENQGGGEQLCHCTDHCELFRQESYFAYLFGVREPGFYGAIDIATRESISFITRLPEEYVVWLKKIKLLSYFQETYLVDKVSYIDQMLDILHEQKQNSEKAVLFLLHGLNTDSGSYSKPAKFEGIVKFEKDLSTLHPILTECRVWKTSMELSVIQFANDISSEAHIEVMRNIKVGRKEYQLESMFLHHTYVYGGCRHCSYTCICATGDNRAKLLDVYWTMDKRTKWKLLDGFVEIPSLTQDDLEDPLGLPAPSTEEMVIVMRIAKGRVMYGFRGGTAGITAQEVAGDVRMTNESLKSYKVWINVEENLICVYNNGDGVPVEIYVPKLWGELPAKYGEIYVQLQESVRGCDVYLVQPTCPPANESLMELRIMIDACRRASVKTITAVIPYFGYVRADRKTQGRESIAAKLVANLITEAGAHHVLALDLHSRQSMGYFDIPVDQVYGQPVILGYLASKEARYQDLEKRVSTENMAVGISGGDHTACSSEVTINMHSAKDEIAKLREELQVTKDHIMQYNEVNEQNKILHSRLKALHIRLAERDHNYSKASVENSSHDTSDDSGMQGAVNYLRRSKEMAEIEMTLLRESNMRLREENKHNFEEYQKLREADQQKTSEVEHLQSKSDNGQEVASDNDATWEDVKTFQERFPDFNLEVEVGFDEGRNDREQEWNRAKEQHKAQTGVQEGNKRVGVQTRKRSTVPGADLPHLIEPSRTLVTPGQSGRSQRNLIITQEA